MATFTFKATEDDRPGGGVYKIPGSGSTWSIKQSDYPEMNLSGVTANNFFLKASCNGSPDYAWVRSETGWCNVGGSYYGGNKGTLSVSHTSSGATVSVVGVTNRTVNCYKETGESGSRSQSSGYTYTLYMSRTPIV